MDTPIHMKHVSLPAEVNEALLEERNKLPADLSFHPVPVHSSPWSVKDDKLGSTDYLVWDYTERIMMMKGWMTITMMMLDEGDDGDDDEGYGKDNHVLALKGWMDPVAQYQPLESQSLQATSNNMSSHIIISATHKSTRKRTKSAIM